MTSTYNVTACCFTWFIIALITRLVLNVEAQTNISLAGDSPDIVYSPFLCNASQAIADPAMCNGAWTVQNLPEAEGGSVVTTSGPGPGSQNTLPQMFLTFQGSALYLRTSALSNATANITLSSFALGTTISAEVNTSVGLIVVVDLPPSQATTLSITYLNKSSLVPARLDIESITISVPDNCTTCTSVFPTSLPPTSAVPPATSTTTIFATSTSLSSRSHRQSTALIVGETLCATFGAFLLSAACILLWLRRRGRRRDMAEKQQRMKEEAASQVMVP